MRHKHSLQTLFRNSAACGISSPPSGGCHPNPQVTVSLCYLRGPTITPSQERRKRSPLMEANEDRLGDSFTFPGMFRVRTLVRCQSGARNGLSREDAFALIPAVWRECRISHRVPSGEEMACDSPRRPAISAFGCGSPSFGRPLLSALQHEKLF